MTALLEALARSNVADPGALSRLIGSSYETARKMWVGERVPTDAQVIAICSKCGVSQDDTAACLAMAISDRGKEAGRYLEMEVKGGLKTARTAKKYQSIPVYSSIRAGCGDWPSPSTDEVADEVLVTEEEYKSKYFAMVATGDSMYPTIEDGEYCIFEPAEHMQPQEGDIVAVCVTGYEQWMLKRLKTTPGRIILMSDNKKHAPIVIEARDNCIAVKGVLVRSVRLHKRKARLFY